MSTVAERTRFILAKSDRVQELAETLGKSYDEVEHDLQAILKQAEAWSSPEAKERNKVYRQKKAARLNAIKAAM